MRAWFSGKLVDVLRVRVERVKERTRTGIVTNWKEPGMEVKPQASQAQALDF